MENAIKLSGLVLFIYHLSKIVHHGAVTIRHPRKKITEKFGSKIVI